MIILTGKEVKDLAEYAGYTVTGGEDEIEESEFTILPCPKDGVFDDSGKASFSNYVVVCDGCDNNECSPIGDQRLTKYKY